MGRRALTSGLSPGGAMLVAGRSPGGSDRRLFERTVGPLVLNLVLLVFLARAVALVSDTRRAQRQRTRRAARQAGVPLAQSGDIVRLRPRGGGPHAIAARARLNGGVLPFLRPG